VWSNTSPSFKFKSNWYELLSDVPQNLSQYAPPLYGQCSLMVRVVLLICTIVISLIALTTAARENSYTKPELTEDNILLIKNGRYDLAFADLYIVHNTSVTQGWLYPPFLKISYLIAGIFFRRSRLTVLCRMTQTLAAKVSNPVSFVTTLHFICVLRITVGSCALEYNDILSVLTP
jgi:hypothetical protein